MIHTTDLKCSILTLSLHFSLLHDGQLSVTLNTTALPHTTSTDSYNRIVKLFLLPLWPVNSSVKIKLASDILLLRSYSNFS